MKTAASGASSIRQWPPQCGGGFAQGPIPSRNRERKPQCELQIRGVVRAKREAPRQGRERARSAALHRSSSPSHRWMRRSPRAAPDRACADARAPAGRWRTPHARARGSASAPRPPGAAAHWCTRSPGFSRTKRSRPRHPPRKPLSTPALDQPTARRPESRAPQRQAAGTPAPGRSHPRGRPSTAAARATGSASHRRAQARRSS